MTFGGSENAEIEVRTADGFSRVLFGSLARLPEFVDLKRTAILTDRVVRRYIPPEFPEGNIVEVPRGEEAKSLSCAQAVYERFLDMGVGRDWTILGVGGGSVSDLAGFVASTWLRGVEFCVAPTTVLSMVDASVGGKNGVDFRGFKNLIGTFRQPRFVLVDLDVLGSLPAGDVAAGLVEAVKHAIIEGPEHFCLLERAIPRRASGELYRAPGNPQALSEVVRRSIGLKARIVSGDARETGPRRTLNLGHTIGHAVEAVTGLPHGVCVAVGLACSLRLATRRGGSEADARRVLSLLDRLGMPRTLEEAREASGVAPDTFRESVVAALSVDKKRVGERVLFALPRALGAVDVEPIDLREIEDFVREAS